MSVRRVRPLILALVASLASISAFAAVPASGEEIVYHPPNRFVNRIDMANDDAAVVVGFLIRSTSPGTADAWSISVDTVGRRESNGDKAEFYVSGEWGRSRASVYLNTEEVIDDYRVRCAGLRVRYAKRERLAKVRVPRSCLYDVASDRDATRVRLRSSVYGSRPTRDGGATCWFTFAPRRSYSAWLQPGATRDGDAGRVRMRGGSARTSGDGQMPGDSRGC